MFYSYAIKHGYPVLEHVTLPRVGAMLAIMQALSGASSTSSLSNNVNAEMEATENTGQLRDGISNTCLCLAMRAPLCW